jgi:EAL domain-containing protein (putative c-di-GMP-specific phosphodiesterase class I)
VPFRRRRQRLPELKVDRAFIAGLADKPRSRAVLGAIVAMGAALDLPVVAEGVETDEQAAQLRALGCPLAQGFLFARPMPAAEIDALRLSARG